MEWTGVRLSRKISGTPETRAGLDSAGACAPRRPWREPPLEARLRVPSAEHRRKTQFGGGYAQQSASQGSTLEGESLCDQAHDCFWFRRFDFGIDPYALCSGPSGN